MQLLKIIVSIKMMNLYENYIVPEEMLFIELM